MAESAAYGWIVPPAKLWVFFERDQRGAHLIGVGDGKHEPEHGVGVGAPRDRRPRPRGDSREGRRRTKLGAQDVGERVGDHLPAGAGVQAQPELVGQRAGRAEQAGLVAEQSGDLLLQRADGRVLAEDVVTDLRLGHRPPHAGARAGEGVGQQVDADRGARHTGQASPSISATRKASSRPCRWFRRGSQTLS